MVSISVLKFIFFALFVIVAVSGKTMWMCFTTHRYNDKEGKEKMINKP